MSEYFTSDHFKLLNKWKGQKRDDSNPEQNRAYEELKKAYEVTELWAKAVQEQLFPAGSYSIRKRPTSQGNAFFPYNWARIYPQKSSPRELAYTVGINSDANFVVNIDTVGLDDADKRRKAYLSLRGSLGNDSSLVAVLPASVGLEKSLPELVEWSIQEINKFALSYEDVAHQLGLTHEVDQTAVLDHFMVNHDFRERQPNWGADKTALFCRLALAVHAAGYDWWFIASTNKQLRLGHKEKGAPKGKVKGSIFLKKDGFEIGGKTFADFTASQLALVNLEDVDRIEQLFLSIGRDKVGSTGAPASRTPYWPDEYIGETLMDDDSEEILLRKPFNRIYYGPPGTGKTYELLRLLKNNYTDVAEAPDSGRWLVEHLASRGWFEVIALVLLDAGRPLKVAEIVNHRFYQAKATANGRTENLTQGAWGYLQRHTWSKSTTVEAALARRAEIAVFDKDDRSNWYLVDELKEQLSDLLPVLDKLNAGPGPGSVNTRYEFVTFHQSYGYEEFVEGLRPETGVDANDQIRYEILHGPLRKLCARAEADRGRFYAMVIDEINRGNISKIFGELITLIEIDKRADADFAIPVTLPYSGDAFIIPPNVDFIGSMNTADRSLALVDTALRRRFEFVPTLPNPEVLKSLAVVTQGVTIDVQTLLVVINKRIEALYDRDHTIGHAYFTHIAKLLPAEQFLAFKAAFQHKIIPLLEEYFFEDWQKIRLVLGDNQKKEPFQFIKEMGREEDLTELFGQNHELDQYAIRARYRLDETSLDLPQAYVGIYDPAGQ